MLSKYELKIADLHNIPIGNFKKLVPNFFEKEKYVVHYQNLKFYLSKGLKLKEIHRLLEFYQLQWLKPYIGLDKDRNTFYKLMNKVVYGKAIEN